MKKLGVAVWSSTGQGDGPFSNNTYYQKEVHRLASPEFLVMDLTCKCWSCHCLKLTLIIGSRSFLSFRSQMLSRAKPAVGGDLPHTDKRKKKGRKMPKLEELLSQRDFTGAITLLEVSPKNGTS